MRKKLLILVISFLFCKSIYAQDKKDASPPNVLTIKSSCEMNTASLASLIQNEAGNENIIVISHSSNNERKTFGHRRLNNLAIFFSKGSSVPSNNRTIDSFVIAEGESVKDNGFLDLYIKGKLVLRIFFDKNQDLLVSPCVFTPEEKPCSTDYEKLLYPCKK